MLNKLKYKYGLFRLKNDFRKPEKNAVVCNLANAKSVGIIFEADKIEKFNLIKNFLIKLKKEIPVVKALGFVNNKKLENFHLQPLDFSFFCLNDLNFYFKPNETSVSEFVDKKFDILIDLTINDLLPVKFVLAMSEAMFKVGRFTGQEPVHYDIMFKIADENLIDDENYDYEINKIKLLINNVENYLKIIKPFDYEN